MAVVVPAQICPAELIAILAGLALIGRFMGPRKAAFGGAGDPFAPTITFSFTASGVPVLSVGAPFWGLVAGRAVTGLPYMPRNLNAILVRFAGRRSSCTKEDGG